MNHNEYELAYWQKPHNHNCGKYNSRKTTYNHCLGCTKENRIMRKIREEMRELLAQ